MIKKFFSLGLFLVPLFASAQGSQASAASINLSAEGMGAIVYGSGNLLVAGSQLPIAAVETVGKVTLVTLRAAGESTTLTFRVASNLAGQALLRTGQLVQVVGIGSGKLLYSSGQLLAFLPNEMGRSLVYSSIL